MSVIDKEGATPPRARRLLIVRFTREILLAATSARDATEGETKGTV